MSCIFIPVNTVVFTPLRHRLFKDFVLLSEDTSACLRHLNTVPNLMPHIRNKKDYMNTLLHTSL